MPHGVPGQPGTRCGREPLAAPLSGWPWLAGRRAWLTVSRTAWLAGRRAWLTMSPPPGSPASRT
jgi:hypothetical protein